MTTGKDYRNSLKSPFGAALLVFFAMAEAQAATSADFHSVARACAPEVSSQTLAALVGVESSFNPYAIGVVGGRLERQPATKAEAIATARALDAMGARYSAGIGQVYKGNWGGYGLDHASVFDACSNLKASSGILSNCYQRARETTPDAQAALRKAFSCYYSNNFTTGFQSEKAGQPSYVEKILLSAAKQETAEQVPAIRFIPNDPAVTTQPQALPKAKPAGPESVDFQAPFEVTPQPVAAQAGQDQGGAQTAVKLTATQENRPAEQPVSVPAQAQEPTPYVYPAEQTTEAQSALVY